VNISHPFVGMDRLKLNALIKRCRAQDRKAQKAIYDSYAPLFISIAKRYVGDRMIAEDIMVQTFFKVFTQIKKYSGAGSFEGWMKRILINEALMYLRSNKSKIEGISLDNVQVPKASLIEERLEHEAILRLVDLLPLGYKTVFNLYIIEGYKHREIADLLNISINTSKSQLILAKKKMKALIKAHLYPNLNWE
jgi:RNA polymerase sigma-70 factor (ECF subfamily)